MDRKENKMRKFVTLEEAKEKYPLGLVVFPNTIPPLKIVGYFFDDKFYYPMYHDKFEGYQILEENE